MENNSEKSINIQNKVMEKISAGQVTMRPHWKYTLEKISLESLLVFLIIFGVIVFSLLVHYWKVNELPLLFTFGLDGIRYITMNFPYELIAMGFVLIIIICLLIKKIGNGYKHSGWVWSGVILVVLAFFSSLVVLAGVHESVEKSLEEAQIEPFNQYYSVHLHNIQNQNLIGLINKIKDDDLEITSASTSFHFRMPLIKHFPSDFFPHSGHKVKMIGHWNNDKYEAWGMEIMEDKAK